MCTIPLAVLNGQEGGGLPTATLTLLPLGEFNTPDTQVLLQPTAQNKQALMARKAKNAGGNRRSTARHMEEPRKIMVRGEVQVKNASCSEKEPNSSSDSASI